MRNQDNIAAASTTSAPAPTEDEPKVIICRGCQRTLPGDARYCPHCCGADGRRGATGRGAFLGGLFGVLAGGLIVAVWSSAVGPEQTTWSQVGAPLLACVVVGVLVGIVRSRKA